jgi:hypothetical protein
MTSREPPPSGKFSSTALGQTINAYKYLFSKNAVCEELIIGWQ